MGTNINQMDLTLPTINGQPTQPSYLKAKWDAFRSPPALKSRDEAQKTAPIEGNSAGDGIVIFKQ